MRRPILVLMCAALATVSCKQKPPEPDIPGLIEKLRSTDPVVRGRGTADLVTIGEPAVPALVVLLADPDVQIRHVATTTLWGMGVKARAAVPQLATSLRDPDATVRASAAMALAAIGPQAKGAVLALADTLRDRDRNVRLWAVKALGAIGPGAQAALPALRRMAKDEYLGIAIEETIRSIGAKATIAPTPPEVGAAARP